MMIDSCALTARALLSVLRVRAEPREQDTDMIRFCEVPHCDDDAVRAVKDSWLCEEHAYQAEEVVDFAAGERPSGWDAEHERSYQSALRGETCSECSSSLSSVAEIGAPVWGQAFKCDECGVRYVKVGTSLLRAGERR